MDNQRKEQILKLLSFDTMIKQYMKQPVKSTHRTFSNIPMRNRTTSKNNSNNLFSNFSSIQNYENRKMGQSKSGNKMYKSSYGNMGKKTIDTPISCTQYQTQNERGTSKSVRNLSRGKQTPYAANQASRKHIRHHTDQINVRQKNEETQQKRQNNPHHHMKITLGKQKQNTTNLLISKTSEKVREQDQFSFARETNNQQFNINAEKEQQQIQQIIKQKYKTDPKESAIKNIYSELVLIKPQYNMVDKPQGNNYTMTTTTSKIAQENMNFMEGVGRKIKLPKSKQPACNKNSRLQICKSTFLNVNDCGKQEESEEDIRKKDEKIYTKQKEEKERKEGNKKMATTTVNLLGYKNQNFSKNNNNNKILKGRYKLEKIIGRGLSGVVYKAKDVLSNRFVAIKIIETENVEYQFIKQLEHPNLISYYNSFIQKYPNDSSKKSSKEEKRFLVLEYLPMNLAEYGKKAHQRNNNLSGDKQWGDEVKKIFKQICSGVLYLHSLSMAHRDIKLENIVCSEDVSQVKFIDFGLCLDISTDPESKESKRFCGTTHYMAPQVIKGCCTQPKKADIWSLGVALYILMVGRAPFKAHNEIQTYNKIKNNKTIFPSQMDEKMKQLLAGMLNKNPQQRLTIFQVLHHEWLNH